MDIFTPAMRTLPYEREGGIPPVLETPYDSGSVQRRTRWTKGPIAVTYKFRGHKDELDTDMDFIRTVGLHTAFKYLDKYDYIVTDETVGVGDGATLVYFLDHPYFSNSDLIVYIDSVAVVNPTDYTTTSPYEDGKITFTVPGTPDVSEIITATYQYYHKMYFNFDLQRGPKFKEVAYQVWEMEIQMIEALS